MKENEEKKEEKKEKKGGAVTRESVGAVGALFSALAFLILITGEWIFGDIGKSISEFLLGTFGFGAYPLLIFTGYLSVAAIIGKRFIRNRKGAVAVAVVAVCVLLILHVALTYRWETTGYLSRCFTEPSRPAAERALFASPAGWVGALVVLPLIRLTTRIGALVILSAFLLTAGYLAVCFFRGTRKNSEKKEQTTKNTEKTTHETAAPVRSGPVSSAQSAQTSFPASATSPVPPVYPRQNAQNAPYARPSSVPPVSAAYTGEPQTRQRPGVNLAGAANDRRTAVSGNAFSPFGGYATAPAAMPDGAPSSSSTPVGSGASLRPEDGKDGKTSSFNADENYYKSREFLFGSSPDEIFRKNLIFDDSAYVNRRPPVDPQSLPKVTETFSSSYSAAYENAVNAGEEPARPAKVIAENESGDLYTPYTLKDDAEFSSRGRGGDAASDANVSRPSGSFSARPVSSDSPLFSTDSAPSVMGENEVGGDSDGSSAFFGGANAGKSATGRDMPVYGDGENEKQEDGENKVASERPRFMDMFSSSNPNIYGTDEDAPFPDGRESRIPPSSDSFLHDDESVPPVKEDGENASSDDMLSFGDRRGIFDENDDPYSLRSDYPSSPTSRQSDDAEFSAHDPFSSRTVSDRGLSSERNVSGLSDGRDLSVGRNLLRPEETDDPLLSRGDRTLGREVGNESARSDPEPEPPKKPRVHMPYVPAPINYFDCREAEPDANTAEVEQNKQIILDTLDAFRVNEATIASVTCGPAVTRYNVVIPRNISARKVVGLDQDIAMALYAAKGVNIYPNFEDGAVSIEVPNKKRQFVQLGCMLTGDAFVHAKPNSLMFAMGKDVGNRKIYGDIYKMTHLLVAGASGSGKSVFLRSLIISLIYKYSPDELRLILIDPKKTEFVLYDHLPHLMIDEILTDINKVIQSLNWAIGEMNRRYGLFEQKSRSGTYVVNIDEYNASLSEGEAKLPKIVIIVDELADLMLTAKKDVEDRIQNLTQKSRAAGIHLIIATQRPSTDVITGVIKGNLPTRIAFAVASDVDSRVILDTSGAQKLLGMGDLLYLTAGMSSPGRLQGASIESEDAQKVVSYIKEHNEPDFDESASAYINNTKAGAEEADDADEGVEEVYIEALRFIIQSGSASISMIQRKCSVGYNKAGKIIEWMEDMGYISAFDGAKARKVLITKEEFENRYGPL